MPAEVALKIAKKMQRPEEARSPKKKSRHLHFETQGACILCPRGTGGGLHSHSPPKVRSKWRPTHANPFMAFLVQNPSLSLSTRRPGPRRLTV